MKLRRLFISLLLSLFVLTSASVADLINIGDFSKWFKDAVNREKDVKKINI